MHYAAAIAVLLASGTNAGAFGYKKGPHFPGTGISPPLATGGFFDGCKPLVEQGHGIVCAPHNFPTASAAAPAMPTGTGYQSPPFMPVGTEGTPAPTGVPQLPNSFMNPKERRAHGHHHNDDFPYPTGAGEGRPACYVDMPGRFEDVPSEMQAADTDGHPVRIMARPPIKYQCWTEGAVAATWEYAGANHWPAAPTA
ncbi:hypothetical protein CC78DRAFT_567647 [Lojkania enalia]|uniref:Uncharacterized protein n=1 Tax=Lojkania enalia TaxID=147567 RepID=A0A9P4KG05_9PLEO|nr:hypothetical protein CC78DRAFT_567647 [Didymosphaeria enalia]